MQKFDPKDFVRNMQCNNKREGAPAEHNGTPRKLKDGSWGAWVAKTDADVMFEDVINVTTKAGKTFKKICLQIVFECEDGCIVRTA